MMVRLTVNGAVYERDVEPRLLLSDFIRNELSLTGTHVGCAQLKMHAYPKVQLGCG